MAIFVFFKMAAVRHVAFLKLRFSMFLDVKSANARHHVKLRQNQSNGCGDIAILQFFKIAAAAILNFQKFKFLMAGTFLRANLRYCDKFHQDRKIRC